jgi:hypothetical protein
VVRAGLSAERQAVEGRYQDALKRAANRGCGAVVRQFEAAVANSQAMLARAFEEVDRLAKSDQELYATYYELRVMRLPSGSGLPDAPSWDELRQRVDMALFGENREKIRFAALALDGRGLRNYGNCRVILREEMTAHRTSVFEENSVLFMKNRRLEYWDQIPHGFRAGWQERARICVAKLADKLTAAMQPADFPGILIQDGTGTGCDDFVEAHVFGTLTIRAFQKVFVTRKRRIPSEAKISALRHKLTAAGVDCEVIS